MDDSANTSVVEMPETWIELGKSFGLPSTDVSKYARSLLVSEGHPLPARMPSPAQLGSVFVAKLTQVLTTITLHSQINIAPGGTPKQKLSKFEKAIEEKKIRDALDSHPNLLGHNLIQTVADELTLSLKEVRAVFDEAHKCLVSERKVAAEMRAFELEQERKKRGYEEHSAGAEVSRRELSRAAREAPGLPQPTGGAKARKTPPKPPEPVTERPAGMPEPQEDLELDGLLRAAWVAERAGVPPEAVMGPLRTELVKKHPTLSTCTDQDFQQAIASAYSKASAGRKTSMERAAARMSSERALGSQGR